MNKYDSYIQNLPLNPDLLNIKDHPSDIPLADWLKYNNRVNQMVVEATNAAHNKEIFDVASKYLRKTARKISLCEIHRWYV